MERILATLLMRSNQVVSSAQIIEEIWGERPPRRATAAVHVYISQLRKLLNRAANADAGTPSPIVTVSPGYLLRVGPDDLDMFVFQRLLRDGRAHMLDGEYHEADRVLEAALGLWRGPALSRLCEGPIVGGHVAGLEEERLECIEMRIEAQLRIGRHRAVVSELHGLIAEHPLNERFYGQLMRALHLSERRSDALRIYQRAREVINRELGLEPGPMLREVHGEVLADDERYLKSAV
ncbi:AfsR/SARP family transcriptional regulator [Actinomadura spongiicola]|nr:AfsR/SARP family transcriptional regulator [Actinomadura spongiicola]